MYSKLFLLLFLLVSPNQVSGRKGLYYARHLPRGEYCSFKGYVPGGNKVTVKRITAPTAKMEDGILGAFGSNMGKIVAGTQGNELIMKGLSKLGKLAKIAPKLGTALGIFGIGLGIVQAFTDPSPQDILDKANEAIRKLTDEVNHRLDEMKGYVDHKTINLEKDLAGREYKSLFKMWGNCLKETTKKKVDECQEDAAKDIMAARPKFALFSSKVHANQKLSTFDVKRLEAALLLFRDYVVLCLASLSALTATYADSPSHKLDFSRYAKDLNNEIKWSALYVRNAVSMIEKMHTDGDYCKETVSCKTKEIWEGWPGAHTQQSVDCQCVFDRAGVSSHTCHENVMIRWDGKRKLGNDWTYYTTFQKNWEEGGKWIALKLFHERPYMKKLKEAISNYWQNTLLDVVPSWEKLEVRLPKGDQMAERDWRSMRSMDYERRRQQVEDEMAMEMDSQYAEDEYSQSPYQRDVQHNDYESYGDRMPAYRVREGRQRYEDGDLYKPVSYRNEDLSYGERREMFDASHMRLERGGYQISRDASPYMRLPYRTSTRRNEERFSDEFYTE
eukprot:TCONS_00054783-protein